MTTSTGSVADRFPEIPRRIIIAVDVPERLSSKSISEVCNLMASRLRYRLAAQYRQQTHARVLARIAQERQCP